MLDDPLRTKGRYERKFSIVSDPALARQRVLKIGEAMGFRPDSHAQPGGQYSIASLYFDTPDFAALEANADGAYFHVKFRVRAYEGGRNLYYEIKFKRGELIYKVRRVMEHTGLSPGLCRRAFRSMALESGSRSLVDRSVLAMIDRLQPGCLVRYRRTPLVGPQNERVCLDSHLAFAAPLALPEHWFCNGLAPVNEKLSILEVKAHPRAVSRCLLAFGRLARHDIARFSKYCEAASWVYGDPSAYGLNPYLGLPVLPAARVNMTAPYKPILQSAEANAERG